MRKATLREQHHRGHRAGHACEGSSGTWEIPTTPPARAVRKREGNEAPRTVGGKSERLMVPTKSVDPVERDPAEGRGRRAAEPMEGTMEEAQTSQTVSTKL